jgi:hypothetical protein
MSIYFDCLATPAKALVDAESRKVITPEDAKKLAKERVLTRKSMAEEAITNLKAFDSEQPRLVQEQCCPPYFVREPVRILVDLFP